MNLIILVMTVFLIKTSNGIDTENEKHLEPNIAILPRKAGFRFEDDIDYPSQGDNSKVTFEEQTAPFKFEETPSISDKTPSSGGGPITFQDDNRIEDTGHKKKKRRRRRKPRYQIQGQYPGGVQGQYPGGVQGQYPGGVQGPFPGFPGQPLPGQGPYPVAPGQAYPEGGHGFEPVGVRPAGQFYRPPRRPKQSFAFEALSKVTGALTSIALYDDYQCVPRLLCEAAGGGALGSSNVLQSVTGLQPLLTLLSAYSGISTSPLFVFGRAVFLGMTSKGNTASCRYAYPQCPTDPEQLVHYLNNHNGGFFRFFNAPQQQIPQNLEQFYNQLSSYGLAQPNQQNYAVNDPQNQQPNPQFNQNTQYPPQYGLGDPQNINGQYGFYSPQYGLYDQLNHQNPGQQFGLQPQANPQQQGYHQPNDGQNYGFYNPQYYQIPQPNPYDPYTQFSGPPNPYAQKYAYGNHKKRKTNKGKYGFANASYKDNSAEGNRIQKRIQNKPDYVYVDGNIDNENESKFKWIFPDNNKKGENGNNNVRGGKNLKFPNENSSANVVNSDSNKRKAKSIIFPESQNPKFVNYHDQYPPINDDSKIRNPKYSVDNVVVSNYNHNNYGHSVNDQTYDNLKDDDDVQTVYIVRNDPNNPEIVKIRKGQNIF